MTTSCFLPDCGCKKWGRTQWKSESKAQKLCFLAPGCKIRTSNTRSTDWEHCQAAVTSSTVMTSNHTSHRCSEMYPDVKNTANETFWMKSFLWKHCIFHVQLLQQNLETNFYSGQVSWDEVSPNDAAALLKKFIRELPAPLLTAEYLNTFSAVRGQWTWRAPAAVAKQTHVFGYVMIRPVFSVWNRFTT